MNNLLEIENIKKNYHTLNGEIEALKDVSLEVKEGSFVSIVGTSGCGKSTLLNIIAGLEDKTSGNIKFKKDIKIGYMLQEDALLPWLTVLDNALLGLKITNNLEDIDYVKYLLKTYGLEKFMDKYPKELSGGMKQRVALIRTLATKPDLLLLDEPFSALDYQSRLKVSNDVYNIIKKEKKTAIMITHDIAEAISLSEEVFLLSKSPAILKKHYDIVMKERSTPIKNRSLPEFSYYYDMIWRDIDEPI